MLFLFHCRLVISLWMKFMVVMQPMTSSVSVLKAINAKHHTRNTVLESSGLYLKVTYQIGLSVTFLMQSFHHCRYQPFKIIYSGVFLTKSQGFRVEHGLKGSGH